MSQPEPRSTPTEMQYANITPFIGHYWCHLILLVLLIFIFIDSISVRCVDMTNARVWFYKYFFCNNFIHGKRTHLILFFFQINYCITSGWRRMVCRLLEMRTGSAYSHFVHCADVCSCVVVLFLMHVVIYVCRRQYLTVSLCSVHSSGVKCYVLYLFVFFFTRLGHPKFPFVWFGMRKLCGTDRRRGRQLFDIEPFGIVIFFFF